MLANLVHILDQVATPDIRHARLFGAVVVLSVSLRTLALVLELPLLSPTVLVPSPHVFLQLLLSLPRLLNIFWDAAVNFSLSFRCYREECRHRIERLYSHFIFPHLSRLHICFAEATSGRGRCLRLLSSQWLQRYAMIILHFPPRNIPTNLSTQPAWLSLGPVTGFRQRPSIAVALRNLIKRFRTWQQSSVYRILDCLAICISDLPSLSNDFRRSRRRPARFVQKP